MALKTKTRSFYALIRHPFLAILLCLWLQKPKCFHDLIRTLFLVLLLRFSPQNQNGKFLCRDKIFATCFFCLVYGYKIRNGNFLRLHKNFVSCSFPLFMVSKTKAGNFYGLIRPLFLVIFCGFNFQQGTFL